MAGGKTGRFAKLAGMTASVAANYAKTRLTNAFQSAEAAAKERARSYQESGERIAETLGELKGAAMKIGQMASMQGDLLPKELAQALTKLQREAPPMPYEVIAEQIEKELGKSPESLFTRFEQTPFASASIGQVHRARTDDGREVVVKVQYPGVDGSVGSDLSHLRLALRASGLLKSASINNLDGLFAEIRARLEEELDYCNEADNVRAFAAYHAKHDFLVVPAVIGERSSQRVLTLEYQPGDTIHQLDGPQYTQEIRNRIGENIFKMVLGQLFENHALHADPNPANFAFRPDGSIVIYDFGCVKKVPDAIVVAYARTLQAALDEDYAAVEEGMIALGARRVEGPPVEPELYRFWRDILVRPFIEEFDYGESQVHERAREAAPMFLKHLPSFQAPVEVVFIDRVAIGHYGNLRKLRARGRFGDLVRGAIAPVVKKGS
jgi:predicted unusual protein kinase regulating ubiquinone biosynthesis (AarF/ABC1/UbiB family)